ncbi:MAG: hypothetical protein IJT77_07435 [Clostridia bacterium]|nr:hypothetical protein [Clostridia bacterium]
MKKLISVITVLLLVMSLSAAFAEEEVPEINWADYEADVASLGYGTNFITFDDVAVKMWMPDIMVQYEVDDESRASGVIDLYGNEDGSAGMVAMLIDGKYDDITELADEISKSSEDVEVAILNGLGVLTYTTPDDPDTRYVAFLVESGEVFMLGLYPMTNETFETLASCMVASIQPE